MGCDIGRQLDVHLRCPVLHVEKGGIGDGEGVACGKAVAPEIFVEQGKSRLDHFAALCLHCAGAETGGLVQHVRWLKFLGLEYPPKSLSVNRAHDVVHDLDRMGLAVGIRRQKLLFRRRARKPRGNGAEFGKDRPIVTEQSRDLALGIDLIEGRFVSFSAGHIQLLGLIGLPGLLQKNMCTDRAGVGSPEKFHRDLLQGGSK
jgi:hypothetical protein